MPHRLKLTFIFTIILLFIIAAVSFGCTDKGYNTETDTEGKSNIDTTADTDESVVETDPINGKELDKPMELENVKTIKIDTAAEHQTIESFGASGAWWAQYVGDWTDLTSDGMEVREYIAQLLFDKEKGIGLTAYRYNIGGGSRGSSKSNISDPWRRAYSFEVEPGVYDWNRDAAAVWFMRRAVELGVEEVIMFVNSPLERLTVSGMAHASPSQKDFSNLPRENYEAFADYVLDVAEHFKAEGLPIKFISPINEPQWDWTGGQEGCHYDANEVVALLKVFIEKIEKRPGLEGVEISAPEGGEWQKETSNICRVMLADETLRSYFTTLDNHSYWTDAAAKKSFTEYFKSRYPYLKFRMSEWCEMVNGRDLTIDSALNLAQQIYEDMTILDVVSWQYWIAVSCYDYRDGLIYVDNTTHKVSIPKRLWAMGNYSRFIDPGYIRVESKSVAGLSCSAYKGVNEDGEDELVIVFVNKQTKPVNVDFSGFDTSAYNRISVNVTDKTRNLEEIFYGKYSADVAIEIPRQSITTVVISSHGE